MASVLGSTTSSARDEKRLDAALAAANGTVAEKTLERQNVARTTCMVDKNPVLAYARHMPEEDSPVRRVKLFQNGRNQAVRIPREFELPGEDALMRRDGLRLIIEPVGPRSLVALLKTLSPIDDDFAPVAELPTDPIHL
jgi:antitoxin VapB